jgi:hypothetical protein
MAEPNGHFGRFRAMVMRGYVGALPPTQLRVLLVFELHADSDGRAYPGAKRIAQILGISERNVRKAIQSLIRLGILTGGAPGRPRQNKCVRQITIPGKVVTRATLTVDEKAARLARFPSNKLADPVAKKGRKLSQKTGRIGQRNVAAPARGTASDQPTELLKNSVEVNCQPNAVEGEMAGKWKNGKGLVERELRLAGIVGKDLEELLANDAVVKTSPSVIRLIAIDTRCRAQENPAALLIKMLQETDHSARKMTVDEFCELVNGRHVIEVKGKAVSGAAYLPEGKFRILFPDNRTADSACEKVLALPMTLSDQYP